MIVFRARERAVHVPVELRQRHDHGVVQVALKPFRCLEDVELVLDDGTANRDAELVPAEVRLRLARRLLERIHRVERLVAVELERFAVNRVPAALGRHRHRTAGGPAVLGR